MLFLKRHTLKNLVVGGLLLTLLGFRSLCEMGQAHGASHCCNEPVTSNHSDGSFHISESHHENDHHNEQTPVPCPEHNVPGYCCSNWYLFTVDRYDVSPLIGNAVLGAHAEVSPLNASRGTDTNFISNSTLLTANCRAPDIPFFLSTHSFRI